MLTKEQLETFHRDGFIILRAFADFIMCDAIVEIAKIHLKYRIEPIETEEGYESHSQSYRTDVVDYRSHDEEENQIVRRLRQVYERDILFRQWIENEKIRPILKQILDDEVVIVTAHHNSIMTKMPQRSTQTRWHQDRRYWRYSDNNLVSVWLALDDEYSQNGVLEFIPQSHKMVFAPEQLDEKSYLKEEYLPNKSIIDKKCSFELHKGDVVIFHSLLMHRANRNETDRPKISFVYTVKGSKTYALENSRSASYPEIWLR